MKQTFKILLIFFFVSVKCSKGATSVN